MSAVNRISECALLTGRRVVWSPRCPRSSLPVVVGEVEEGGKAGLWFPQGGPLPPEALLLERLKIPTGEGKKKTDLETKMSGKKETKYVEWRKISTKEETEMRGRENERRRKEKKNKNR